MADPIPQTPSDKVVPVTGSAVVVAVARVVATPNEISMHILRSGRPETRFTFAEAQAISSSIISQLAVVRGAPFKAGAP